MLASADPSSEGSLVASFPPGPDGRGELVQQNVDGGTGWITESHQRT